MVLLALFLITVAFIIAAVITKIEWVMYTATAFFIPTFMGCCFAIQSWFKARRD